jgi:hypothetical protein
MCTRGPNAKFRVCRNILYRLDGFYYCSVFSNKNGLPSNNGFCFQGHIYGISYLWVMYVHQFFFSSWRYEIGSPGSVAPNRPIVPVFYYECVWRICGMASGMKVLIWSQESLPHSRKVFSIYNYESAWRAAADLGLLGTQRGCNGAAVPYI